MVDDWTKAAATEFFDELRKLSMAAEKLSAAADKAVELAGAAVSQMDEIRAEVAKMNAPLVQEFPLLVPQAGGMSEWITSDGQSFFKKQSADEWQAKLNEVRA